MGEIYGKASVGLLWLGEEPDQPAPALDNETQSTVAAMLSSQDTFVRDIVSSYNNPNFPELREMVTSLETSLTQNTPYKGEDDFRVNKTNPEHWKKDQSLGSVARYHTNAKMQADTVFQVFCLLRSLASGRHLHEIPQLKFEPDGYHSYPTNCRRTLHWLASREWWRRIWTVQECILPKKCVLLYGPATISWSMFLEAIANFQRHRNSCCSECQGVQDMLNFEVDLALPIIKLRNMWHKSGHGKIRPETLLWSFRTREASEPRDKIFGIRSLITDISTRNAIVPDYRKATWDAKIFVRSVVSIIKQTGDLDVLCRAAHARRDMMVSLPSWCPNFQQTDAPAGSLDRWTSQMPLYKASGGKRASVSCLDDMILVTEARLVAEVKRTFSSMLYHTHKGQIEAYQDWYDSVKDYFEDKSTDIWKRGLRRVLMGDSILGTREQSQVQGDRTFRRVKHQGPGSSEDELAYKTWCLSQGLDDLCTTANFNSSGIDGSTKSDLPIPESSRSSQVAHAVKTTTMARKLFITKLGNIGLGPIFVSFGIPSDEVFVIPGGKTPFILRPLGERHIHGLGKMPCYQFIGECFLDGFMDGEGMRDFEAQRKTMYIL